MMEGSLTQGLKPRQKPAQIIGMMVDMGRIGWRQRRGGGQFGGQPRLADTPEAGLARVVWALDPARGILSRRHWPMLAPRDPAGAGPAVPMLAGVLRFEIRSMAAEGPGAGGWSPGWSPGPEASATLLPRAFEVTIETRRHGLLRLVVAR